MAESTLTIATADLKRAFGLYTGYGRDPADWSADGEDLNDFNAALEIGLRQAYFPVRANGMTHRWRWMYPSATLTTSAPYSTGTIAVTAGSVTLTGGTWPSWAADGQLETSGGVHTVALRVSDSMLTLDDTTVEVDAGTTYSLTQAEYELPDDFLDFDSPLTYQANASTYYPAIQLVDEQQLRIRQQAHHFVNRPIWGALIPKVVDPTVESQRWLLFLVPTPDAAYRFSYRYQRAPETLDDDNIYHWGGPPFSELIRRSLLAAAEEMFNDGSTQMYQRFLGALESAIAYDRQHNAPEFLGYNGDGTMYESLPHRFMPRGDSAYYEDINYVPL